MKRLSLIILAIAAFTALGAGGSASASAAEFAADEYPYTIEGKSSAEWNNGNFKIANGTTTCLPPSFSSSEIEPTSTVVSESTKDGTCYAQEAAPLKMNGCQFEFQLESTLNVACPEGKAMTTEVLWCDIELVFEGPGAIVSYENLGNGVRVFGHMDFTAIPEEKCAWENEPMESSYSPVWDLTAVNGEGKPTGLSVDSGHAPHFEGESYPLNLAGQGTVILKNETNGDQISCSGTNLTSQPNLWGASKNVSLTPSFSGCVTKLAAGPELPATVEAHGCQLTMHALNVVPFGAQGGVTCNKAGEAIEYNVYASQEALEKGESVCTAEIPGQVLGNDLALANVGIGSERGIDIEGELPEIEWISSGACGSGVFSDAALSIDVTLKGKGGGGTQVGAFVSGDEL